MSAWKLWNLWNLCRRWLQFGWFSLVFNYVLFDDYGLTLLVFLFCEACSECNFSTLPKNCLLNFGNLAPSSSSLDCVFHSTKEKYSSNDGPPEVSRERVQRRTVQDKIPSFMEGFSNSEDDKGNEKEIVMSPRDPHP